MAQRWEGEEMEEGRGGRMVGKLAKILGFSLVSQRGKGELRRGKQWGAGRAPAFYRAARYRAVRSRTFSWRLRKKNM